MDAERRRRRWRCRARRCDPACCGGRPPGVVPNNDLREAPEGVPAEADRHQHQNGSGRTAGRRSAAGRPLARRLPVDPLGEPEGEDADDDVDEPAGDVARAGETLEQRGLDEAFSLACSGGSSRRGCPRGRDDLHLDRRGARRGAAAASSACSAAAPNRSRRPPKAIAQTREPGPAERSPAITSDTQCTSSSTRRAARRRPESRRPAPASERARHVPAAAAEQQRRGGVERRRRRRVAARERRAEGLRRSGSASAGRGRRDPSRAVVAKWLPSVTASRNGITNRLRTRIDSTMATTIASSVTTVARRRGR